MFTKNPPPKKTAAQLLDLPKLPITNDLEAVSLLRVLTFANDNQILQDQSIPEVCAQHCARIYGPPSVHYASADARLKALVSVSKNSLHYMQ
jgi:hypothetical protein